MRINNFLTMFIVLSLIICPMIAHAVQNYDSPDILKQPRLTYDLKARGPVHQTYINTTISRIPPILLSQFLSFLGQNDLFKTSYVCHEWYISTTIAKPKVLFDFSGKCLNITEHCLVSQFNYSGLILRDCSIGLDKLSILGRLVGRSLKKIDLSENGIDNEGVRIIAANFSALTELTLCDNKINDPLAIYTIAQLNTLTKLDLGNREGLDNIINIIGNCISDAGVIIIAANLKNLTSLHLCNNDISPAGVKAIAENLIALTDLDLGYNPIGSEGALALTDKGLPSLITLNLASALRDAYEDSGDKGAITIATNKLTLTDLDLRGNGITAKAVGIIAQTLTALTRLDLSEIGDVYENRLLGIGDSGVMALSKGKLKQLTSLGLASNNISDEGARFLAKGNLTALIKLDLSVNEISDKGGIALATGNLRMLEELDLYGTMVVDVNEKQIIDIQQAFRDRDVLQLIKDSIYDEKDSELANKLLRLIEPPK